MDSIIFDLDGTLWDSSEQVLTIWNEVLKKHGDLPEITKEQLASCMGLQSKEIGQKLFPQLSEEQQDEILTECHEVECPYLGDHGAVVYPDVERVLTVLAQKYKLFIVSNCQNGYIEAFYKSHQLEKYFIDYEHPGRTGLTKGENIKLIIERNQLKQPIYVGDTKGDLTGARFAGIPFVYASYGFGEVDEFDYVIHRFSDLLELF
ncbi:HAD family hydrolase [Anaerobacillus alkaliphilus]|uniref:HAD family hydrolase n=1 Tax=Anaerobacillus alkaliphilus TaxID=1548597 RepID=A0A4Q0VXF3_9BACI|nr:HAD family hydrolase [Anaerobacillus alkaliphilus]RXJ04209.1 HAD family hydrolase [Anaerobacillus alkaliphilus]